MNGNIAPETWTQSSMVMGIAKNKVLDDIPHDVKHWLYICILCINMTDFLLLL